MLDNSFVLTVLGKDTIDEKIAVCNNYLQTSQNNEVLFYLGDCYCRKVFESDNKQDPSYFVNNLELAINYLSDVVKNDTGELGKKASNYIKQLDLVIADASFVEKDKRIEHYKNIVDLHSNAWLWVSCLYAEQNKWEDSAQAVREYLKKSTLIHEYYLTSLTAEIVDKIQNPVVGTASDNQLSDHFVNIPSLIASDNNGYLINMLVPGRFNQLGYTISEEILIFLETSLEQVESRIKSLDFEMVEHIVEDTVNVSADELKKKHIKNKEHINLVLTSLYTTFARDSINNIDRKSTFYEKVLRCDTDNIEARLFLGNKHFLEAKWSSSLNHNLPIYLNYKDDNTTEGIRLKQYFFNIGIVELLFSAYKLNKTHFVIDKGKPNKELIFFEKILEDSKESTNQNLCELIVRLHEAKSKQLDLHKPQQRINHFGYDPYDLKDYFSGQEKRLEGAFVSLIIKEMRLLEQKNKSLVPNFLRRKK